MMTKNQKMYERFEVYDEIFMNQREYQIGELIEEFEYQCKNKFPHVKKIEKSTFYTDYKKIQEIYDSPFLERKIERNKKTLSYKDPDFRLKNEEIDYYTLKDIKKAIKVLSKLKSRFIHEVLDDLIPRLNSKLNSFSFQQQLVFEDECTNYDGNKWFSPLYEILLKQQVIQVNYYDIRSKKMIDFTFHPYVLKKYNNRWQLYGYNPFSSEDIWNISLDQIKNIEIIENKKLNKSKVKNWDSYFKETIGFTNIKEKQVEEIVLHFRGLSKEFVKTKPMHPDQKYQEIGSILEVRFSAKQNFELSSQILHYQNHVEVIEPESLRNSIKILLDQMKLNYSQ